MKTEDLKEAFKPYVYPYGGSGFMTGSEDQYVINRNAQICTDIAVNFAHQFKPKWIPVEERLPANGVEVLIYDTTSESLLVSKFGSDGYFTACTHLYLDIESEVEFWMPLPSPPQP